MYIIQYLYIYKFVHNIIYNIYIMYTIYIHIYILHIFNIMQYFEHKRLMKNVRRQRRLQSCWLEQEETAS